jgi:hypothetical protein
MTALASSTHRRPRVLPTASNLLKVRGLDLPQLDPADGRDNIAVDDGCVSRQRVRANDLRLPSEEGRGEGGERHVDRERVIALDEALEERPHGFVGFTTGAIAARPDLPPFANGWAQGRLARRASIRGATRFYPAPTPASAEPLGGPAALDVDDVGPSVAAPPYMSLHDPPPMHLPRPLTRIARSPLWQICVCTPKGSL